MSTSKLAFHCAAIAALTLIGCPGDDGGSSGDDGSGSGDDGSAGPTTAGSPTSNGGSSGADTTMTSGPTTGPTSGSSGGETETGTTTGVAACPYPEVAGNPGLELELIAEGFVRPMLVVGDPAQPDRLYVVEQAGTIRVLEPGDTQAPAEPILDISVTTANSLGNEQGLFSMAFHPDFADNRLIYVAYSAPGNAATRVEEWALDASGMAMAGSDRVVIAADQPAGNHNGGMIQFGPDGYLYFGTGDGGGGGDTYSTGQNTNYILGKMLRIGVEPDGANDMPVACGASCSQLGPFDYTVPVDNPFVGMGGFAPEIYAIGLRNPWRFAFDPVDDYLYVADVGQGDREEVSVVESGSNLGWSLMEGEICFTGGCDTTAGPGEVNSDGLTMPVASYPRSVGTSTTGLGVYRSCEVPEWHGRYYFSDYGSARFFAVTWDGATATETGELLDLTNMPVLGGGYNAWGDVYVALNEGAPPFIGDGKIYRVAPQP